MKARYTCIVYYVLTFFLGSAASTLAAQVPVRVHVTTAAGEPVLDAYIALVPVWRPWNAPLAEEITSTGSSLFRVPQGTYHLVAGAKGFQVSTEGPFSFFDELGGNLNIILRPVARAAGRVTDDIGNPLVGVRVSESRAATVAPLSKLSPLALRHLSSDWSVVTDESGNWSLGVPDGKVPLIFTLEGRTAQWRYYKTSDPELLHVSMFPGASLRVICDRSDPNMFITLEREGDDPPNSVPRSWQRQVWARGLSAASVAWTTLPTGVYSIYVKYVDPNFFMRRAKRVGKVALSATEATEVSVVLPEAKHPASKILRLYLDGVSPDELDTDDLEALGMNASDEVKSVQSIVHEVIGGIVLQLSVDNAKPPFYLVTADRFVAPISDIPDAKIDDVSNQPILAALHPRADAHFVLRSADKELQFPKVGWAELRDCSKTIRVRVPVKIGHGNLAQLTAPAACRNAVLSFKPFEPVLLMKPFRPGDQSLGEFVLRAAGSADVRVVREPGGGVVAGAAVRVTAPGDDSKATGLRGLVAEAQTGPDGWAHIDAIPVLRGLQFVARAPGGDLSLVTEGTAEPRERLVVDPLSIPRPSVLIINPKIKPSVLTAFPGARVRIVFIQPVDPRRMELEKRQQNVRNEDSPVRFEPLKPGRWRLTAVVEVAGTFATLKIDEVDLKAGETRHIDAELEPLVFQGRVTSGRNPVAARITLENRFATDVARPHFDSRKDGTFNALLPNRGMYGVVAVRLDSQGDDVPVGDVDFSAPSQPVEIVIPSTVAVVVHVRAEREPVADALVVTTLTRNAIGSIEQHRRARATDASGNVRFEHLVPGEWIFSTRDELGRRGAEKSVVLRESEDADIILDVERANLIRGIVHDPAGIGAPRVRIDCLFLGAAGTPSRSSTETDLDGNFDIDTYSKLAAPALCSAMDPAGVIDAFKAMSGETASVQLPAATATLRISDWGQQYAPDTFWLAAPDGRVISLSTAANVAGRFGPPFQIPAIAAGEWRVIRIQSIPQWAALAVGLGSTLPFVADVKLDAGRSETIHIYETPFSQPGSH